jgi:drug/metabolite transporter (DMT)-like permease
MAIAYGIERQIPARKDLPWFVITGVVGVFLNQALYIFGVAYAGASVASIMQLLAAPITSLLSILFKLEKFSKFKLVGLSMSVLGSLRCFRFPLFRVVFTLAISSSNRADAWCA